jgi:2-polyprenyl-6-methoxyphenol hydroxylase-like FAD-dependent oxidoreductase
MARTTETSVLIVGAGPAGLTAAIALARAGVDCLVIDRRPAPSEHPRATVVSTRSMELLRSWGLEERMLAAGVEVDWLMWLCETLARVDEGTGIEIGLPTRAQAALISPTAPACVSQPAFERALLDELRSLETARVEVGSTLVALDGTRAAVRAADGERVVSTEYVVAADGAYSTVRSALGIPMRGADDVLVAVTALVRAPLWDVVGEHRYGFYATDVAGVESSFFPTGRGDAWLFGYLVEPGAERSLPATRELEARIRRAVGTDRVPLHVERVGSFSSSARIADRFRSGRVFLVGDAAHRVTPRGGTGMNTAIHDGYDLGWKLAWVLRGWAGAGLLDSYEAERRPVAEHNVARSADPGGTRRPPGEELRVDLGGRIGHHWIDGADGRRSTLDLPGHGLTLLTGPVADAWEEAAAAVGGLPLALRRLDELTARALGIRSGGALLVRPDGVPVESWSRSAGATPALVRAVADVTSAARDTAAA